MPFSAIRCATGDLSIVTSSAAYAETMATIYRKKHETGSADTVIEEIIHTFQTDWYGFIRIDVTDQLNAHINDVLRHHQLRGFDAVHLASALVIHEQLSGNLFFACFDQRLNLAARTAGLETF